MSKANNGDNNAYPTIYPGADPRTFQGLSKRELFAAMCMHGLSSNPIPINGAENDSDVTKIIAELSILQADALLKALEETK